MKHNKKVALVALSLATVVLMSGAAGIAQADKHEGRDNNQGMRQMRHAGQNKGEHLNKRLSQAVVDGKITEDQKNEIIEKMKQNHEQIKQNRQIEDKSERHNAMKSMRDQMKQWLQDKGIDPTVVLPRPFFNR